MLIFTITTILALITPDTSQIDYIKPHISNSGAQSVSFSFYLRLGADLQANEILKIQFPAQFDQVNGIGFQAGSCLINSVLHACVKEGTHIVKITVGSVLRQREKLHIMVTDIDNPTTAGGTSYFSIWTMRSSGNQIIDFNYAFGVTGFTFGIGALQGLTATLPAGSSNEVSTNTSLDIKFKSAAAIPAQSIFQIVMPPPFQLLSTSTCRAIAYDTNTVAIQGPFTCSVQSNLMVITGLSVDLAAQSGIGFKVENFLTPYYAISAGDVSIEVHVLQHDSQVVLEKGMVDCPEVIPGTINNVTLYAYNDYSKFTKNNRILSRLQFATSTSLPDTSEIIVDYSASVIVNPVDECTAGQDCVSCWIESGVPHLIGQRPTCTLTGTEITIHFQGTIPAGTTISLVNQLVLGTTNVSNLWIYSRRQTSHEIIDTNLGANGGTTVDQTYEALQNVSVAYDQIYALKTGKATITFSIPAGGNTVPSGGSIIVDFPSGFIVPSGEAVTVTLDNGDTLAAGATQYQDGSLTITTASDDILAGETITIEISTSGSGLIYPSVAFSDSSPYEWGVTLQGGTGKYARSIFGYLAPGQLEKGATSSIVLVNANTAGMWTLFTINVKVSYALSMTSSRYSFMNFQFLAADFSNDLGTGLSDGTISCQIIQGLSFQQNNPTCAFDQDGSTPSITVSGFETVNIGTIVSLKILIKHATSDTNITVQTFYQDYNSITTMVQLDTLAVTQQAATNNNWIIKKFTHQTESKVNSETSLTIHVQPGAGIATTGDDYIVLEFSLDWSIDQDSIFTIANTSGQSVEIWNTQYTSIAFIKLAPNAFSSGSETPINIDGIHTPMYANAGTPSVKIGILLNNSGTPIYNNFESIDDPDTVLLDSQVDTLTMTVSSNSDHRLSIDVTYSFTLDLIHPLSQDGKIEIVFPVGYDISLSVCTTNLPPRSADSPISCSINLLVLTISNIKAIAANTSGITVIVDTVQNPDLATTATFTARTVYDSDNTHNVQAKTTGLELELQSALAAGEANVYQLTFFPITEEFTGEMILEFALESSVARGGEAVITFPGSFSIPSSVNNNCIFNLHYSSCVVVGSKLTIRPLTYFPAGIRMVLYIPSINVPSASAAVSPIQIQSIWNSKIQCDNPATPPESFSFTPAQKTQTGLTFTMTFSPQNAGAISTYTFTLNLTSALTTSMGILIWFPSEYSGWLGDVQCASSAALDADGWMMCYNSSNNNYLTLWGLKAMDAGQTITVTIHGVKNPAVPSVATGTFRVATLNSDNSVVDSSQPGSSITPTSVPNILQLTKIQLSTYGTKLESTYTIEFMTTSVISATNGGARIIFPSQQFLYEVYGFQQTYVCTASIIESDGTVNQWIPEAACTNTMQNMMEVTGNSNSIPIGKKLQIVINGLKNPSQPIQTNNITIQTFDFSNKKILDMTYGSTNNSDRLKFQEMKQDIFVENLSGLLETAPGVSNVFEIHTASQKMPSREQLIFTPHIFSLHPTDQLTITPSPIVLAIGQSKTQFSISTAHTISLGNYLIKWKMMNGESESLIYSEPQYSLLKISSTLKISVWSDMVPTLYQDTVSIPIFIHTTNPPTTQLDVQITVPTGFTATPAIAVFAPGQSTTQFQIAVGAETAVGSYQVGLQLAGANVSSYNLVENTLQFDLAAVDQTLPELASFVVNYPRQRLSINLTIQSTEPCTFYYLHSERGITKPEAEQLKQAAMSGTAGYMIGYAGATQLYNFTVQGLTAETSYILYGAFEDMKNQMSTVFSFEYFTAEIYDSIVFQSKFIGTSPTQEEIASIVIPAIAAQIALTDTTRITLLTYENSIAQFQFINDQNSTLPSPLDLIVYMAIPSEINQRLPAGSAFTLDPNFSIVQSAQIVPNPRPEWRIFPIVPSNQSAGDGGITKILVDFSVTTDGTVYAQVISSNDESPSSGQVTQMLNAQGNPAEVATQIDVEANQNYQLVLEGLTPARSYTIMVSAKNNDSRFPRTMRDDIMARVEVITRAESRNINIDDGSNAALLLVKAITLLLIVFQQMGKNKKRMNSFDDITPLPSNFAQELIDLETAMDFNCNLDMVKRLSELYSVTLTQTAIEYYESIQNPKFMHYQERLHTLLTRREVIDLLSNKFDNNRNKETFDSDSIKRRQEVVEKNKHIRSQQLSRHLGNVSEQQKAENAVKTQLVAEKGFTRRIADNIKRQIGNLQQRLNQRKSRSLSNQAKHRRESSFEGQPVVNLQATQESQMDRFETELENLMEKFIEEKYQLQARIKEKQQLQLQDIKQMEDLEIKQQLEEQIQRNIKQELQDALKEIERQRREEINNLRKLYLIN